MKILSMSGFVPEHICDTVRFTQFSGDRNISHYCGYASDFISEILSDGSIEGAVFPKTCDSSRIISGYLSGTGKFIFQLNVPYPDSPAADRFFAESIRKYKESVEQFFGICIPDVAERCERINRRNAELAKAYGRLENVSYYDYLSSVHQMLRLPLKEQTVREFPCITGRNKKRAFLAGSFLANPEIARLIEDAGFSIVGDNLPESGRLASAEPVAPDSDDLYLSIARSILSQRPSPSRNHFREIAEADLQEIHAKRADAVIFITQKYCEPYDYLYPVYKKALGKLPVLRLVLNDTEDMRKAELSLEAFADIVGNGRGLTADCR